MPPFRVPRHLWSGAHLALLKPRAARKSALWNRTPCPWAGWRIGTALYQHKDASVSPVETGLLSGKIPYIRGGSGLKHAVVFFGGNALFKRLDTPGPKGRDNVWT